MMQREQVGLEFDTYDGLDELSAEWAMLLRQSREACQLAYAPYSQFHVGAAALLNNGVVVKASNKENASFPAGSCAERNLLNTISDQHPGTVVQAMAISAMSPELEPGMTLTPCGICRQVMCEVERVQGHPIAVLMQKGDGKVLVVRNAGILLPFHFYLPETKK